MPLTTLFPEEPVTLRQGKVGDCYFLSALDCIFSAGPEGIAKVKSLFTETENGITVRIKRTSISSHLKPEKLAGKYDYFYDKDRNEDVFMISNERLKLIDATPMGVKSNSLAVKILEHLSSYYYVEDWDHADLFASVLAHNLDKRHAGTSTEFVGYLIGVSTEDLRDLDQIIKLKTIDPDYPVYISMGYGKKDQHGNTHGRHGLRLDKVIENSGSAGGYDFVLVNPWDNTKTETYSVGDIKTRNFRFCLFNIKPEMTALKKLLLELPLLDGKTVLAEPELQKLILDFQAKTPDFGIEEVKRILVLYKSMPNIASLHELLTPVEKQSFYAMVYSANGHKDIFLSHLLSQVQRLEVLKFVLRNQGLGVTSTPVAIDICLQARDSELFGLFNRVDFLAQIENSRLNKNIFLKNLIDLEFAQAVVNFKNLQNIATYIQRYNDTHPNATLEISLSNDIIFSRIKEKAIEEKILRLGGTRETSINYVESGLIHNYLFNKIDYVTNAGNLRSLIMQKICPKSVVENIDSPNWVLHGTTYFLLHKTLPPVVEEKIRAGDKSLSQAMYINILSDANIRNPRELFMALYTLSTINHSLAKGLYHIASESFKEKFGYTFSAFVQEINTSGVSEFSQWFLNTLASKENRDVVKEQPKFIVTEYIDRINNFPVTFEELLSPETINKQASLLINQLKAISTESRLAVAQRQLGNSSEEIFAFSQALESKISMVDEAAKNRLKLIQESERIFQKTLGYIQGFEFSFADAYNLTEIERRNIKFKDDLKESIASIELNCAMMVLGFSKHVNQLKEALKTKEEKMDQLARKQSIFLQTAEISIHKAIFNVSAISSSFSSFTNEFLISEEITKRLEALYSIQSDEAVLNAQRALGLDNTHLKLESAIESKALLIIEGAEKQFLILKKAQDTLLLIPKEIEKLSISYQTYQSETEIRQHERVLFDKLENISKSSEVTNILSVLGFDGLPITIIDAVKEKKSQIQLLANQAIHKLNLRNMINDAIVRINSIEVNFSGISKQEIENRSRNLKALINSIEAEPQLQEALKAQPDKTREVEHAILAMNNKIHITASRFLHDYEIAVVKTILHNSGFDKHYNIILDKSKQLEQKAKKDPKGYQKAAQAAKKLFDTLDTERNKLIHSTQSIQERVDSFKKTIGEAIPIALAVLQEHRGWKQVLADIASVIVTLVSFFTSYLVTNRFRLFKLQTDSEKKIVELEKIVKTISVNQGGN